MEQARQRMGVRALVDDVAALQRLHLEEHVQVSSTRPRMPFGWRSCTKTAQLQSGAELDVATPWSRVVAMLFRRFADQLRVSGRLLNHEELLVHAFRRVDNDEVICIDGIVRVVVPFAKVDPSGNDLMDVQAPKAGALIVARLRRVEWMHEDALASAEAVWLPSATHEQPGVPLDTLEHLYGFDLRQFHGDRGYALPERDATAPCVVVRRHPVSSDLRGIKRILQFYNANRLLDGVQSFLLPRQIQEQDSESFSALAAAQKKRWAMERVVHAQELDGRGRRREAISEFSSALKIDDSNTDAWFGRAKVQARCQQYDLAEMDLRELLRIDPSYPGAQDELRSVSSKLGHSRRVLSTSSTPLSVTPPAASTAIRSSPTVTRQRRRSRSNSRSRDRSKSSSVVASQRRSADRHEAAAAPSEAALLSRLEKDRLRELLEKDTKQQRKRRRRSPSTDDSSSDSDSNDRHRKKKAKKKSRKSDKKKKNKKTRKKKSKHRSHDRSRRRSRAGSVSSASDYSSDNSSAETRRPLKSRSSSNATHQGNDIESELPPILQRQQHRLWG